MQPERSSLRVFFGSSQKLLLLLHRAEKKAAGFKTVKCKVGQGLEEDAAACKAVREAIGSSHTLRVDANMGWSTYEEAAANIEALSEYDLELVEQPLPRHQYDDLAKLRERTAVPIMVDESLWDPAECAVVIQAGAADVANVYIAESGGVLKAATNLAMCAPQSPSSSQRRQEPRLTSGLLVQV